MNHLFRSFPLLLAVLSALVFLQACAPGVSRQNVNTSINVQYGTVQSIAQVDLQSNAGSGAVMGGILGAIVGNNALQGAAVGAASGALLTVAAEGSNKANSYMVSMPNGRTIKIVTETGGLRVGDCVAVEQGRTTNIRFASPVYCNYPNHPGVTHPDVVAEAKDDASVCNQAKQQALKATTSAEIDLTVKQVRALCES